MKNISFAPVRALYMSTDDEWTRDHPEKAWEGSRMDALLAIGPANLSEEQFDALTESEALQLILSDSESGYLLSEMEHKLLFDDSGEHPYRRHLRELVDDGVFPKSDIPATTEGTLMNVLRGGSLREQEARSELDNIMAFILKAGLMSSRAIARSTGIAYNTVLRRAQGADERVTNELVRSYHSYAAEEGEYHLQDEVEGEEPQIEVENEGTDDPDSQVRSIARMASLAYIRLAKISDLKGSFIATETAFVDTFLWVLDRSPEIAAEILTSIFRDVFPPGTRWGEAWEKIKDGMVMAARGEDRARLTQALWLIRNDPHNNDGALETSR